MAAESLQFQPTTDRQVAEMYMHDHLDGFHPITPQILFEAHAHAYEVNIAEGWVNAPEGFLHFGDTRISVGYMAQSIKGLDTAWQEQIDPDGRETLYEFNRRGEIYNAEECDSLFGTVINELGDTPEDNETKFDLLYMLYVGFTRDPQQQAETLPTASS